MIELTADTLWMVADGKLTPWEGDLAEYRQYLLSRERSEAPRKDPTLSDKDRKEERRLAAKKRQLLAPLRQEMQRAEKEMEKLESAKAKLQKALADPEIYNGGTDRLLTLQRELGAVEKSLGETEEIWLAAQGRLEEAAAASV